MRYNSEMIKFAVDSIDSVLGNGYAHDHPSLLQAWLQADAILNLSHVFANELPISIKDVIIELANESK